MVNEINISTNTHNKKSVNVSAGTSKIDINLTKDLSAYYSMLAKDWAIKTNGTVDDIEYSAKYYADVAQRIAEQFGISKEEVIAALQTEGALQIANIQEVAEPILAEVDKLEPISQNIDSVVGVAENIDDIINKTVDVGQTITSAPGTMASVENVGTIYAPVLDFTIPRGEKGADGGMDATYDEETKTLSFYNETGTFLYPKWGDVAGDINNQQDLIDKLKDYATHIDVLSAIASIPQFKLAVVESLPATGEKMTLYLVPKEGTGSDVHNEYIWIEQTSSFEFLGSTAVDLTDYVKNTDYATADKAGVIKISSYYGTAMSSVGGYLMATKKTLDGYKSSTPNLVIGKETLENVLTQYATNEKVGEIDEILDQINGGTSLLTTKAMAITEADYNALESKDPNTLYLIEE